MIWSAHNQPHSVVDITHPHCQRTRVKKLLCHNQSWFRGVGNVVGEGIPKNLQEHVQSEIMLILCIY